MVFFLNGLLLKFPKNTVFWAAEIRSFTKNVGLIKMYVSALLFLLVHSIICYERFCVINKIHTRALYLLKKMMRFTFQIWCTKNNLWISVENIAQLPRIFWFKIFTTRLYSTEPFTFIHNKAHLIHSSLCWAHNLCANGNNKFSVRILKETWRTPAVNTIDFFFSLNQLILKRQIGSAFSQFMSFSFCNNIVRSSLDRVPKHKY